VFIDYSTRNFKTHLDLTSDRFVGQDSRESTLRRNLLITGIASLVNCILQWRLRKGNTAREQEETPLSKITGSQELFAGIVYAMDWYVYVCVRAQAFRDLFAINHIRCKYTRTNIVYKTSQIFMNLICIYGCTSEIARLHLKFYFCFIKFINSIMKQQWFKIS